MKLIFSVLILLSVDRIGRQRNKKIITSKAKQINAKLNRWYQKLRTYNGPPILAVSESEPENDEAPSSDVDLDGYQRNECRHLNQSRNTTKILKMYNLVIGLMLPRLSSKGLPHKRHRSRRL